jgi:hypothetical protein
MQTGGKFFPDIIFPDQRRVKITCICRTEVKKGTFYPRINLKYNICFQPFLPLVAVDDKTIIIRL